MTEQTNLVPKRRFKEFQNTHPWEDFKLKDTANYIRGSFPQPYGNKEWYDEENGNPFVQVADIGFDLRLNNETKLKISKLAEPKSRYVEAGKVIVALQGSIETSIGRVAITQYPSFIDRTILIFDSYKLPMDEQFFAYSIQKIFKREKESAPGVTISTITKEALSEFQISLPLLEEQRKIGIFFKQLDDVIALYKRKLEKTKALKSAYLSEMFPAEGECEPKRRFVGFTQAWEQRKLGEITDSFSGGTPSANNRDYYNGSIPFIRSGEINSNKTELFITEEALNNSSAKLVAKGDILYALYGATSGEVGISQINGAINQAVLAIKPKYGDDSYLITLWLKKQKQTIISTYLQGGQGNLAGSIVKNLMIVLPINKEEQTKISSFFKQLDETIALHQRKLEKLQNIKKAYLNEMFV